MTADEIAAHARGVLTPEEIAAHPEHATLAALRADPLYPQLCATFEATEGNLLELTEPDTALQQIATIRWALDTYAPRLSNTAEVGFHKGFFFFLLRYLRPDAAFSHYACDIRTESIDAVAVLNSAHPGEPPFLYFVRGDSRLVWGDVLESIGQSADLVWIDGGHTAGILSHDLSMAMDYGARLILVDDAEWLPALAGIISDCCNVYGYTRVIPPTSQDRRGIAVLVRA
jgi:hypothetical protein